MFVGAGGGAFDDVRDAEVEIENEGILEWGVEARRKAALVEGGLRFRATCVSASSPSWRSWATR
jgi:hypothetical protein